MQISKSKRFLVLAAPLSLFTPALFTLCPPPPPAVSTASQSNSSLKKQRSRSIFSTFFCCFRNYNVDPPANNTNTSSQPPPVEENGSPPKVSCCPPKCMHCWDVISFFLVPVPPVYVHVSLCPLCCSVTRSGSSRSPVYVLPFPLHAGWVGSSAPQYQLMVALAMALHGSSVPDRHGGHP